MIFGFKLIRSVDYLLRLGNLFCILQMLVKESLSLSIKHVQCYLKDPCLIRMREARLELCGTSMMKFFCKNN